MSTTVAPIERTRIQRGRFRPTRAGLLNVWQYDEQEFEFHDGRLLLRGGNGAGKTKALELLLPFLLDADLTPSRLDPTGQSVKGMRYNLLDADQRSRLGYVWIEFGRIDDEGIERYVTLGAGLRATEASKGADAWYFVTPQRVNRNLKLVDEGNTTLTREKLRAALAPLGRVYETSTEYKAHVDRELFGFGTDRYHSLVELLLNLRRPQLSKALDPELLTSALSDSLPPLDAATIASVADAFSELEKQQRSLHEVKRARDAVQVFLTSYEKYAKILARARAKRLLEAKNRAIKANERLEKAARREQGLRDAIQALEEEILAYKAEQEELKGKLAALNASPEARQASDLTRLGEHVRGLAKDVERLRESAQEIHKEAGVDEKALQGLQRHLDAARQKGNELNEDTTTRAMAAGLEIIHDLLQRDLATAGKVDQEIEARWNARVAMREADIKSLLALTEQLRKNEHAKTELDAAQGRAEEALRERMEASKNMRTQLEDALDAAERAAEQWRDGLVGLTISADQLDAITESFTESGLKERRHLRIIAHATSSRTDAIVDARKGLERERSLLEETAAEIEREIAGLQQQKDNPPKAPAWAREERSSRAGAPFYQLVDVRADIAPPDAANLEAALHGIGLLDAWVRPDGELAVPTLDSILVAQGKAAVSGLNTALRAVENPHVPVETIERILSRIELVPDAHAEGDFAEVVVGMNGTWRAGLVRGRSTKESVEHIGEFARETTRKKKLADAQHRSEVVAGKIQTLESKIGEQTDLIKLVRSEAESFPDLAALFEAYANLAKAAAAEDFARAQLIEAQKRVAAIRLELERLDRSRREFAREKALESVLDQLPTIRENIVAYRLGAGQWFRALEDVSRRQADHIERKLLLGKKKDAHARMVEDLRLKEAEHGRRNSELDELRRTSGAAVARLQEALATAQARQEELGRLETKKNDDLRDKNRDLGRAEGEHADARTNLQQANTSHDEAEVSLRNLAATGVLEMVIERDVRPEDAETLAKMVDARTIEMPSDDGALEDATNEVHPRYQMLARDLSTEYSLSGTHADGVFVVTIVHAGKASTASQMHASLQKEYELQAGLLEKHERELIERHLFGEVSTQIRTRIREANALVKDMNDQLEEHPTASGLMVRLSWSVDPEIGKIGERGIAAIKRSANLLTEPEKAALNEFLQDCQKKTREEMPTATQAEQLMHALDYRRWYRFDLFWKKPGQEDFTRLTKRTHATGSAGEKAVALYLPLFAAAAAQYKSAKPTAPRLVLLDEVFAGVDQATRGSCMGLLAAFDMDVMMTAFSEWACYPELPGIAIYHLERDAIVRGVLATPFWWDGNQRHDLVPEA